MDPILSFQGEHRFLSNFFPARVPLDGVWYPTVEHAYQAAKTTVLEERELVRLCRSPGQAKRMGRALTIREDWENRRVVIMRLLLWEKFQIPHLRAALLATRDARLEEGNLWGDTFWGVHNGRGRNVLGELLMEIRLAIVAEGRSARGEAGPE